jgi:glutamine synthetase
MSAIEKFLKFSKEENIKFVDFRFTDSKGKWQHITHDIHNIDTATLQDGVMFDGSSIAGWQAINKSDMILKPDLASYFIDPFMTHETVVVFCDVVDPETNSGYELDPRHTAKLAEKYLQKTGIGDIAYFGPELEFFIFDNVLFENGNYGSFYEVDSIEHPNNSGREYSEGNLGHRPKQKGGYFPVPPVDSGFDLREEIVTTMREIGLDPLLHHHEVAPAQHEMGTKYNSLLIAADNIQKYKYAVHNVASAYGKSATFMPKPVYNDNGSGMHIHQSIWKNSKTLFSGGEYANLSKEALYYIGGIIKHAKALNAISNASTNSYKRLVPGFEAPTILAYSERNRSAAIRIPYATNANAKRVEVRFPDATANPYLVFAAMLMAGIDGIKNKIHPGDADERDLYELSAADLKDKQQVARSLQDALEALDKDRDFLTQGGVFTNKQIDAYINLKMQEVADLNHRPHPIEFENYYSC